MPEGVEIKYSCVTGYGEGLIKAALMVDLGYIETVRIIKRRRFSSPTLISYWTSADRI